MINSSGIKDHRVVSHEEWLSALTAFLAKEKEFTRLRDELSQRALVHCSCGPSAGHDEEHSEGARCVCNEHILFFWRCC